MNDQTAKQSARKAEEAKSDAAVQPKPEAGANHGGGTAEPGPAPARVLPSLTMDRFGLKESRNPGFWHGAPSEVIVEDLLQPSYWANFAGTLRRNATIEVHWDNSSQFAELYVLDLGRNWVSVALMRHVKLERAAAPPDIDKYVVGYNGAVDQWRIVNVVNRSVLRAGFATEQDAQRFLAEHKKKLG
jgi:hypothetical protein